MSRILYITLKENTEKTSKPHKYGSVNFESCFIISGGVLFIYNVHIGQQMMNDILKRM
jgi:hypothetical protein